MTGQGMLSLGLHGPFYFSFVRVVLIRFWKMSLEG